MLQPLVLHDVEVQLSQALEPPAVREKIGTSLPQHFSQASSGLSRLVKLTSNSTTSPQSSHLYSYSGIKVAFSAHTEYPAGA